MASGERFGYEWHKFHTILPEHEGQFLKWVQPLDRADFAGKRVLEVGCGIGRNLYWPLQYGASGVTGIDVDSRTVAVAKRNLDASKADIRQCSAYELNERDAYDIAFSIGVIHHLEKPQEAIKRMVEATKPGGTVLVWVYGKEGNEFIVTMVNALRAILVPLPPIISNILSFPLTVPLWVWLKCFSHHKPYWKQLADFRFSHVRAIVLDQLLPKIAHYWTRDEALALLRDTGLTDIGCVHVNEMSWTVKGTKQG